MAELSDDNLIRKRSPRVEQIGPEGADLEGYYGVRFHQGHHELEMIDFARISAIPFSDVSGKSNSRRVSSEELLLEVQPPFRPRRGFQWWTHLR